MQENMRRIAEIHILEARKIALRLFSYSSTIIPEEYKPQIAELLYVDLVNFGLHARRVNELCELSDNQFDCGVSRFVIDESTFNNPIEKTYQFALNRLIHAANFTIGYIEWGRDRIHLSSTDWIASFANVEPDRVSYGIAHVPIYGIAYCFLTKVIPEIKIKHPNIQF